MLEPKQGIVSSLNADKCGYCGFDFAEENGQSDGRSGLQSVVSQFF